MQVVLQGREKKCRNGQSHIMRETRSSRERIRRIVIKIRLYPALEAP
jgi:hypothetical protein